MATTPEDKEEIPRILIVEDEDLTRGAFKRQFSRAEGLEVMIVGTKGEALSAIEEGVDLVVTDIKSNTEGLYGIEIAQAAIVKGTPFALMSGANMDDVPEDIRNQAVAKLAKPDDTIRLSAFVMKTMEGIRNKVKEVADPLQPEKSEPEK